MLCHFLLLLSISFVLVTADSVGYTEDDQLGTGDSYRLDVSRLDSSPEVTISNAISVSRRSNRNPLRIVPSTLSTSASPWSSTVPRTLISTPVSSPHGTNLVSGFGHGEPSVFLLDISSASSTSSGLATSTGSSTDSVSLTSSTTSVASIGSTSNTLTTTTTLSTPPITGVPTPTTTSSAIPSYTAGVLPAPTDWQALRGYAWNVSSSGTLGFNDFMATKNLQGDKCRTGSIGSSIIWNCGDMECASDWTVCGFSMGPGFYGTNSVMTVDTGNLTNIGDNVFMPAWQGDPPPSGNQTAWGMDMSNVVPINDTHGVVYAWEIWRGASDESYVDRGNAVASVTLGSTFPIATRQGPLLTDASAIQLGLLATMADGGYIYLYSMPQTTSIITVTRVPASDAVFDVTQYQTLNSSGVWISGIPTPSEAVASYGMVTAQPNGFGCATYGSVFYNAYLQKYLMLCNIYEHYTNMYASDTPVGPWSAEYGILSGVLGYGSMAHPEYSPDGGKTIPWTQGPDTVFDIFTISFF